MPSDINDYNREENARLNKEIEKLKKINTELECQLRKKWNEKETKQFTDFLENIYGKEKNNTVIKLKQNIKQNLFYRI